MFCKNGFIKNFIKICRKIPVPESNFLFKKRLWHSCFHVEFAKFSRHLFYRTSLIATSELDKNVILIRLIIFGFIYLSDLINKSSAVSLWWDLICFFYRISNRSLFLFLSILYFFHTGK